MRTKIDRGWYEVRGSHVVATFHYGGDRCRDWIVTQDAEQARAIHHAAQNADPLDPRYRIHLYDVDGVFNRLSDATAALLR